MKNKYAAILIIISFLCFTSCKKDIEPPIVEITTTEVSEITGESATCGGNVSFDGKLSATKRGVCWSKTTNPTLGNCLGNTEDGLGTGSFTSKIIKLERETTYYVCAYATNSKGTSYGDQHAFTTLLRTVPTVTTAVVSEITGISATCGGNVTSDGGLAVTARGVCWSTTQNPTIANAHTSNGSGAGSFTSNLMGLSINTTYYVRAYATNAKGTAYGAVKQVKTLTGLPTVTTNTVTNITTASATCGGNVTTDGGFSVTSRGICWSTSSNPTLSDNHTNNGSGIGNFTSNLTGLTMGITYYVRAYATNSKGTVYGEQKSFMTNNYLILANGTNTMPNYPFNALGLDMTNHHYQMIYPASSLTAAEGKTIKKLTYYAVNSTSNFGTPYFYVRVGLTTTSNLNSGFAPTPSNTTYALITISGGYLTIYLDTPLYYTSGYNLLVDFQRSTVYNNNNSDYFFFYGLIGNSNVSRSYVIGPAGTPLENISSFSPKLKIDF